MSDHKFQQNGPGIVGSDICTVCGKERSDHEPRDRIASLQAEVERLTLERDEAQSGRDAYKTMLAQAEDDLAKLREGAEPVAKPDFVGDDGKPLDIGAGDALAIVEDMPETPAEAYAKGWNDCRLSRTTERAVTEAWQPIDTAPHACHFLATYWDGEFGEWVVAVTMRPVS